MNVRRKSDPRESNHLSERATGVINQNTSIKLGLILTVLLGIGSPVAGAIFLYGQFKAMQTTVNAGIEEIKEIKTEVKDLNKVHLEAQRASSEAREEIKNLYYAHVTDPDIHKNLLVRLEFVKSELKSIEQQIKEHKHHVQ